MDSKKEDVENFYIDAANDYNTKNLFLFFEKKQIVIKNATSEKKGDKVTTYKLEYLYSPDALIGIETIKKEGLYD